MTWEEVSEISDKSPYNNIKYFVETGTYMATTTMMASKYYDHVYTTEIHEGLHKESKQKASDAGVNNITFLLGDSIELLPKITEAVKEGAVFFLDAHISGQDSGWNNKQRVPLLEELDVILKHKLGPSIFILDDLRFWKGKDQQAWDWDFDTTTVLKKFIDHNHEIQAFFERNDRFWILIK